MCQVMGAVNITIRVDEETKRQFDDFCENVGMNITTAIVLYMKAVLRTRELPFIITDLDMPAHTKKAALAKGKAAMKKAQAQAVINGMEDITLDEINAEIQASRQEDRGYKEQVKRQ